MWAHEMSIQLGDTIESALRSLANGENSIGFYMNHNWTDAGRPARRNGDQAKCTTSERNEMKMKMKNSYSV